MPTTCVLGKEHLIAAAGMNEVGAGGVFHSTTTDADHDCSVVIYSQLDFGKVMLARRSTDVQEDGASNHPF